MRRLSQEEKAGIYTTVIVHLAVVIVLLLAGLDWSIRRENTFVLDFSALEEKERLQEEIEKLEQEAAFKERIAQLLEQELEATPLRGVAVDRGALKDDRGTDAEQLYKDAQRLQEESASVPSTIWSTSRAWANVIASSRSNSARPATCPFRRIVALAPGRLPFSLPSIPAVLSLTPKSMTPSHLKTAVCAISPSAPPAFPSSPPRRTPPPSSKATSSTNSSHNTNAGSGRAARVRTKKCSSSSTLPLFRQSIVTAAYPTHPPHGPRLHWPTSTGSRAPHAPAAVILHKRERSRLAVGAKRPRGFRGILPPS